MNKEIKTSVESIVGSLKYKRDATTKSIAAINCKIPAEAALLQGRCKDIVENVFVAEKCCHLSLRI